MPTARRTKDRIPDKRRRRNVAQQERRTNPQSHADISPVWEVLPDGHSEVGPRPAVMRRDAHLRRGLALTDVISALLAFVAVTALIEPGHAQPRPADALLVPFVLLAGKVIGLYDRDQHVLSKTTIDEIPSIFYLAVVYSLAVWLGEVALVRGYLARPQVFGMVVATFGLVTLGRLLVRRLAFSFATAERCIVVGDRLDAARIATKLQSARSVSATVVGHVALNANEDLRDASESSVKRLGDCGNLTWIVAEHDVERAIIASRSDSQEQILDAIRLVKALGVKVSVVPRLLEVVGSSSTFDEVDGIWLLGVRQYGLVRSSELLKRAMDVSVAGLGLVILCPLFLMLTIAVRLDSSGSIFFRQPRIGQLGNRFWMLKFRSMVPDAEARKAELGSLNEAEGGLFKINQDPRITRVGRFLRRTSLDELPQLINVLRGDMSLVGPRPLVPDEDALIEGWRRRRLAVKPGMTGLWQIFGSSRIPMNEMVKIDYIYGANWSLWLDLRILLRTVPYLIRGGGQ